MESEVRAVSSDELKRLLLACGWTHQNLADQLRMDRSNVTRWAAGQAPKQHAFHIAARHVLELATIEPSQSVDSSVARRQLLNDYGFAIRKAKCAHPACQRRNRQMRAEREPHDHILLGKILRVYCDGTNTHKHPRVTRAIDRKGRLWEIIPGRAERNSPHLKRKMQSAHWQL